MLFDVHSLCCNGVYGCRNWSYLTVQAVPMNLVCIYHCAQCDIFASLRCTTCSPILFEPADVLTLLLVIHGSRIKITGLLGLQLAFSLNSNFYASIATEMRCLEDSVYRYQPVSLIFSSKLKFRCLYMTSDFWDFTGHWKLRLNILVQSSFKGMVVMNWFISIVVKYCIVSFHAFRWLGSRKSMLPAKDLQGTIFKTT